jgi:hypothetical protein
MQAPSQKLEARSQKLTGFGHVPHFCLVASGFSLQVAGSFSNLLECHRKVTPEMPHDNRPIIADAVRSPAGRFVAPAVFIAALIVGTAAAVFYGLGDLTLSHYDARAHLVVARRIVDSLTPGWKQIGAVWLPLPHLVTMPLVQWDWAYRTGYGSTAVSVLMVSAGLSALATALFRTTRSLPAALTAPALILLNPNVLYLQSTPMTEPMLFGLSLLCVWLAGRWIDSVGGRSMVPLGVGLAALTLTRYEGWFVAGALVVIAALGLRRPTIRQVIALAAPVAAAMAAFVLLSKGSTGVWFVTSGFYEPDPSMLHQVWPVLERVWFGTRELGGRVLLFAGLFGLVAGVVALARGRVAAALPVALLATAILPLYGFFQGHPFRIRYMVPVVMALGALSALAVAALPRRVQAAAALALVTAAGWQRPPLAAGSAMVLEAQWETPFRLARRDVTAYLVREWDGTPILASMGSLGHYMQETSRDGFALADFVHEGNGDLWLSARVRPASYVNWVLIEERAEGGDELAARARRDGMFLAGLERVAEGGGVALYRKR